MFQQIFDFVLNSVYSLTQFSNWLFSPIGNGIDVSPIAIFSIGGFTTIFILHVIHLVNPVG